MTSPSKREDFIVEALDFGKNRYGSNQKDMGSRPTELKFLSKLQVCTIFLWANYGGLHHETWDKFGGSSRLPQQKTHL